MKCEKMLFSLVILGLVFLLNSCENDSKSVVEEQIEEVEDEWTNDENEAYYQIPSPDEMFGFIKQSGVEYSPKILNSVENIDAYTDPFKQTMNFGIYSADLAYSAAFGEYQSIIKCFGTIQKLGDQIGVSPAMDKSLIQRVQNNLNNADSIVLLTNQIYFSVVDYLEVNQQGDKLGILASAGWLETLYIVTNSIDLEGNEKAAQRLADQKLVLDNLLDYLAKYQSNDNVNQMISWFNELKDVFAEIQEEKTGKETSFKKKGSGKMVLGGGDSSEKITEEQFEKIRDKVNTIRTTIINTEE